MSENNIIKDENAGSSLLLLNGRLPFTEPAAKTQIKNQIYEIILESYLPLIRSLYELARANIVPKITVSLSLELLDVFEEIRIGADFDKFLAERLEAARSDYARFGSSSQKALQKTASFYADYYKNLQAFYFEELFRDIAGAFKILQDKKMAEIVVSATAFVPESGEFASLGRRLEAACERYKIIFEKKPKGVWLDEPCLGAAESGREQYRGETFDEAAASCALEYVLTRFSNIENSGCCLLVREAESSSGSGLSKAPAVSYLAYKTSSGVAVLSDNTQTEMQVTNDEWGYIVDANYRDNGKKDPVSGLKYWCNSKNAHANRGHIYNPEKIGPRIDENAFHYNKLIEGLLSNFYEHNRETALALSCFDIELLGCKWFEGACWIKEVCEKMHKNPYVKRCSAGEFLSAHPPKRHIDFACKRCQPNIP